MSRFKLVTAFIGLFFVSASLQSSPVRLDWTGHVTRIKGEEINAFNLDNVFVDKDKHIFALLQCSHADTLKECELSVITHHFDNREEKKVCKIMPPEKGFEKQVRDLRFLKADQIMIQWSTKLIANPEKEDYRDWIRVWHYSTQLIRPKDCRVTRLYRRNPDPKAADNALDLQFVPRENHVDVVFETDKFECGSASHCILKLDYLLNPLSDNAEPFVNSTLKTIRHVHPIKINNSPEFFFVADRGRYATNTPDDFYTSLSQWQDVNLELVTPFSYSDANGYATLCWRRDKPYRGLRKVMNCKSLDNSRPQNTISIEFSNTLRDQYFPSIHNLPDGDIAYAIAGRIDRYDTVLVEKFNAEGQCKTLAKIDLNKELGYPVRTKFSISDEGKVCVSVFVRECTEENGDCSYRDVMPYKYTFFTTCVSSQVPPDQEYHRCAQNLYLYG